MSISSQIDDLSKRVTDHTAIQALLAALAPTGALCPDVGRYHCLAAVATTNSQQGSALRNGILAKANELQPGTRYDVHRALAILHWTWATELSRLTPQTDVAQACYHFADTLWRNLVMDTDFWMHFANGQAIDDQHLEVAKEEIVDDILTHHVDQAKQHFAADDLAASTFHVSCLHRWSDASRSTKCDSLSAGPDAHDPSLAIEFGGRAEEQLNNWVSEFLRRAHALLSDQTALSHLPDGISRNFEGAIASLGAALKVMPQNKRLLSFLVKQQTDWSYELAVAQQYEQAREIIRLAAEHSEHLAVTHLQEDDTLNPDNQAVALAFRLASQLDDDVARTEKYLHQQKQWGGANDEVEFQIKRQRAQQALEQDDFDSALSHLENVGDRYDNDSHVQQLRAVCYLRKGDAIAERLAQSTAHFAQEWADRGDALLQEIGSYYDDAYQHMSQALATDANEPVLQAQFKAAESRAQNGKYQLVLRAAHDALENDEAEFYPVLLESLQCIPRDSSTSETARHFESHIHFRLAVIAANENQYEESEQHMKLALKCDPANDFFNDQLARVYQAWGGYLVAKCRELLEPIGRSPSKFLEEVSKNRRAIISQSERLYQDALRRFEHARELAGTRREVAESIQTRHADDDLTPAQLEQLIEETPTKESLDEQIRLCRQSSDAAYWNILFQATHSSLEAEAAQHYEQLGQLLLKCPSTHASKSVADNLASAIYFRLGIAAAEDEDFKRAEQLLSKAHELDPKQRVIAEQLDTVRGLRREAKPLKAFAEANAALERKEYDKARHHLEGIRRDFSRYDQVRDMLAFAYFELAKQAANNDNLDEAITLNEKAVKQNSSQGADVLRDNLAHFKQLKREAKPLNDFKQANAALERKDYDKARQHLERIATSFSAYDQVRDALAFAYFELANKAIERKDIDEAIKLNEKAARQNPSQGADIIRKNLEQLKQLKRAGGFGGNEKRNRGVEMANQVVQVLEQIQKTKTPITPDFLDYLIKQLDEAVELTNNDPGIVELRNHLRAQR